MTFSVPIDLLHIQIGTRPTHSINISLVYSPKKICPQFHPFTLGVSVPPLQTVTITPHIVCKKLVHINTSKSPGPDGWPLLALRETAEQICMPLSLLFTKSLESGILPQDWKSVQVTPIFKKGDCHLPNNYHPTSPIIRLMESIIKDEIYEHLSSNHLLCVNQHGFVPGRSCITQLLTAMDYWTKALEQGIPIDIVYLDFKKAFDSVLHISTVYPSSQ